MKLLRHIKKLVALSVVIVAIGFATPASAEVILANGVGAMSESGTDWWGMVTIVGTFINTRVEFAVYDPGMFDAVHGAGMDPSNGTEIVYAYQFFNTAGAPLVNVSVGLDADEPFTGDPLGNVGFLTGTGVDPSAGATAIAADLASVRWDFAAPPVGVGQQSDILIYTCPTLPEWGNVAVKNQYALTGQLLGAVPNPGLVFVPEPGTLALLTVGALSLLRRRRAV